MTKHISKEIHKIDYDPQSIALCLRQLEEEVRECGFEFSATLIRAAVLSLTSENQNIGKSASQKSCG